ncbi:MAG: hypothetical protein JXA03_03320 [Bacteroidales bacterium]|nr:hypothetical protein [Bacteroidales bacterium]
MKTFFRHLPVLIIFIFATACSKDNKDPESTLKSSFIPNTKGNAFSIKGNSVLFRVSDLAARLQFASGASSPEFAQNPSAVHFTGEGGVNEPVGPDIPGSCMVSTMGEPSLGYGWIFNYHPDGRISHINEYEDGYEIRIFFHYDSQKRIIKTEVYDVENDSLYLSFYDSFQYNSQGRITECYEYIENFGGETFYYQYNGSGQIVKMYTNYYGGEFIYDYSNGNVVKETLNVTYGGEVYTETEVYLHDSKNNFWPPLNIPQPFFTFFAWMVSKNNMTKITTTDFEGDISNTSYWYDYNAEGYPSWMYSDDLGWGRIEYLNCH